MIDLTPIQIRSALQQQYTEHLDQQIYQEIHKLVNHSQHINYYSVVELFKSLTPFVDLVHQTIRIQTSYFTDHQLETLADTALSNNMTMIQVVENVDFKIFGANENDILKHSPANKLDLISAVVFDAFNQTFIWVTPNKVKQASVDRLIKYFNNNYKID